ncbi:MAG: hypothetical protein JWO38_7493 [Gemmataceae bacterium]|nr:hypothetical protein [Gemmataceae bacterium]
MPGPFDATLKELVDRFAADWVEILAPLIGLPSATAVDPLDTDLSTVQPAVDKVFRLRPPATGLLHLEHQASWDGGFPDRLVLYSVLLEHRHGGPVYTVVILLRREASSPGLSGVVSRTFPDGAEYLRFAYTTVRLWELPAGQLMAGGIGLAPLALLTDDAARQLPELVSQFAERVEREAPDRETGNLLLTSGFILLGLRYDGAVIRSLFQGVQHMRESSTYQLILEEGREKGLEEGRTRGRVEGRVEGMVQGEQMALLTVLQERFGNIPPAVEARVRATADPARLQAALKQAVRISTPDDLSL